MKLRLFLSRRSLSAKLTVAYSLLLLLVAGALAFSLYWQLRAAQRQAIRDRLSDIISFTLPVIVGDFHAQIRAPSDEQNLAYNTLFWRLQSIQPTLKIVKHIYSLRPQPDGSLVYIIDANADPATHARVGDLYPRVSPVLQSDLTHLTQPIVEEDLYVTPAGDILLSGYAPIYDNTGHIDGLLGIDIDATTIVDSERRATESGLIAFLVTAPFSVLAGWWLARRLTSPVSDLVGGAQRVATGALDTDVPVQSQDELGTLAQAFNIMQAGLRASRLQLEDYARALEQQVEQLDVINRTGRQATLLRDPNALLAEVAHLIQAAFNYYVVFIYITFKETNEVYLGAIAAQGTGNLPLGNRVPMNAESIIGHVAATGEPLVAADVSLEPHYRHYPEFPLTRSELALPLRVGDQVLGVLDLESAALNAFQPDDVRVLQTLADQIAIAIHNSRLFQAEAQARRTADTLREVGQIVGSTLNLDEVLERILASLSEVLEYDSGLIMLLKDGVLYIQAGRGFADPTAVLGSRLPLADYPFIQDVVETAQPVILSDVRDDPRWREANFPVANPIRAWMGIPLIAAGQVLGMLAIESYRPGAYHQDHLLLVTAFAAQAAVALHNAELFQASQVARAEAEQANQLKSRFLANMSHELRTPLNAVINFSYLLTLGTEGDVTDGQADLLNRINDAGRHLLGLINDILDLAKIEAGRMELHLEEVTLPEVIDEVLSTAAGLLANKPEVDLRREIAGDLPLVRADHTRVRQVLLNLLSNAAKFTQRGAITLCAVATGEWVTLSVTDTGPGIPAEDIPKAFSEFVQLEGQGQPRTGGTGLGLPISKRFVEMHGGHMWAESEVGVGSTFFFTLPSLHPATQAEAFQPIESTLARVMVIDDDVARGEAIAQQLGRSYQVLLVTTSHLAASRVRESRPDVIVLEASLSSTHTTAETSDGWDILKVLKADPETRDVPVVMCSLLQGQKVALPLSVNDYLVKPMEREELRRVVGRFAPLGGEVLAVDDDPNALDIVRRILQGKEYHVSTAANGAQGLAAVRAHKPDILMLDLMMPELDGFQVLTELRADPRTADLPVIVMTAKDLSPTEWEQLQAATVTFLQKGQFTPEELVNTVRRAATKPLAA